MNFFLLIFNRRTRQVDVERVDSVHAMEHLREAESRNRGTPEMEVVLLAARNEDDLRKTHRHYFESLNSLLAAP